MTPTAEHKPVDEPIRLFDVRGMGGAPANASQVRVTGVHTEHVDVGDAGARIPKGAVVELRVFATVIGVGNEDEFKTVDGARHRTATTRVHRCKTDSAELVGWVAPEEGEKGLKFDGDHLHPYHGGAPESAPKASQRPRLARAKKDEAPVESEVSAEQMVVEDFLPAPTASVEPPTAETLDEPAEAPEPIPAPPVIPETPPVGKPYVDTSTQTVIGDTEAHLAAYLRALEAVDLRDIAELNGIEAVSPEHDTGELVALGHAIDWGVVDGPSAEDEAAMVTADADPEPVAEANPPAASAPKKPKVAGATVGDRASYTPDALKATSKTDLGAVLFDLTGESTGPTSRLTKGALLEQIATALEQSAAEVGDVPAEDDGLDF